MSSFFTIGLIVFSIPFFLFMYGRFLDENKFLRPLFYALSLFFLLQNIFIAQQLANLEGIVHIKSMLTNTGIVVIGYLIWIVIFFYALAFSINLIKLFVEAVKTRHG